MSPSLLLLTPFVLIAFVSLTTYAIYYYVLICTPNPEARHTTTRGQPVELSDIARGIVMSFVAGCIVSIAYPFRRIAERPLSANTPEATPVILAHGLYHNASAWFAYRAALQAAGFGPIHCFAYPSFRDDFDTLATNLTAFINDVVAANPGRPPLLIGHSLGGLLIRAALSRVEDQSLIAGVITLGTPHQGSKLARIGIGSLARQLDFRGPLVQRLEKQERQPVIPCVAVLSLLDNMVIPVEGLRIRTPGWVQLEGPLECHVWMLWDIRTKTLVLKIASAIREKKDIPACVAELAMEQAKKS